MRKETVSAMRDSYRQVEQAARRDMGEIPCVMATVVKTTGSAYRRPGARMFLYADGRREGSISGGCLEADVAERALKTLETGQPAYVMYDTNAEGGDVFFETGCNGAIGILIEPLTNRNAALCLDWMDECRARRKRRLSPPCTGFRATAARQWVRDSCCMNAAQPKAILPTRR